MRQLLSDERGVMRGGCALLFLAAMTVVMLVDVLNGNTESFGQWLELVGGSVALTLAYWGISSAWNRVKRRI